jgi:hypothetical protein
LDRKLLLIAVCVAFWIPILLHWKRCAMRPTGKTVATPEPGQGRRMPGDG